MSARGKPSRSTALLGVFRELAVDDQAKVVRLALDLAVEAAKQTRSEVRRLDRLIDRAREAATEADREAQEALK